MIPWSSICTAFVDGSGTPMMATVRLSPGRRCEADAAEGMTGFLPVEPASAHPARIPSRAIDTARGRSMVRAAAGSALAARLAPRLRGLVVLGRLFLLVLVLLLAVLLVVLLLVVAVLVPLERFVVLELLLLLGVEGGKVVLLLLRGLRGMLL